MRRTLSLPNAVDRHRVHGSHQKRHSIPFLGRFGVNTTLGVAVNISYQEHSWKEGEADFDNVEDIDLLREEYRLICRNTRS
jgi:hypothetical protein